MSTFPRGISRGLRLAVALVGAYLVVSYFILPQVAKQSAKRHPNLLDGSHLTHTKSGVPGDPVNIALEGSEEDVIRSLAAAGWRPADPLTFRSSMKIAVDTVFKKPDDNAPVSNLFLFGRKEDLAFEKPVGDSPRERHHVRFWRSEKVEDGRTVWVGSAAFDAGVELSHRTGEVTHHIAPDVDAERDVLVADLTQARRVADFRWVDEFHKEREGRNGGGDPWRTDGRLAVVVLVSGATPP